VPVFDVGEIVNPEQWILLLSGEKAGGNKFSWLGHGVQGFLFSG
jgi:hypothetical protein